MCVQQCVLLLASPYGKGKWCEASTHMPPLLERGGVERSETEGIRINPQKGRHLLCTFCPCEKRKQGETSHRRERKETGSQPHRGAPPVSVLYKSFRSPLVKFFLRKNLTKRRCEGRCRAERDGGDKKIGIEKNCGYDFIRLFSEKSCQKARFVIKYKKMREKEKQWGLRKG